MAWLQDTRGGGRVLASSSLGGTAALLGVTLAMRGTVAPKDWQPSGQRSAEVASRI